MFARIVVAIDGSPISDLALQTAFKLAADRSAKVRMVHVVDVLPPAGLGAEYMDYGAYQESAREAAKEVIAAAVAAARTAKVDAEPVSIENVSRDTSGEVVAEAKRWGADLIVMGTHGRTGLGKLLLGSVADGVIKHALSPVLLVRQPAPVKG